MKKILILNIFLAILLASLPCRAELIWGDHFDQEPDFVCTSGGVNGLNAIDGGKDYEDCSCDHTANTEIRIEDGLGYGLSGKGLKYRFDNSGGSTQTCQLRVRDAGTYEHLYWGFRLKIPDQPIGGNDASLKMSRFYADESIIPGINLASGEFYLFWQAASRLGWSSWPKVNLHTVPDSEWHSYVQEFSVGAISDGDSDFFDGSGIYRLWADSTLVFERTNIDWGNFNASSFSWPAGYLSENVENLNGNYNGGVHDIHFDDVVWATTKQEVDAFLGTEVSNAFPASSQAPEISDFLSNPSHTYYCSPTGSNETGDGSIGNPWLDLIGAGSGGAGNAAAPGDLIYFRGGAYPAYPLVNFSRSQNMLSVGGNAENPIVISNYPGEIVTYSDDIIWSMTLDGNFQKLIGTKVGNEYGIQVTGGISVRADNVQISGVEFIEGTYDVSGTGGNPAMLSVPLNDGCNHLKISHNFFHDSENKGPDNRMAAIRFFTTSNAIVEYNIFKDNSELGDSACIGFKDRTTNAIVRHNKFVNDFSGVQYFTQGDTHNGLAVYGNLFYDVDYPFSFRNETGPGIRIYDNVALAIPAEGAFFYYLNADSVVGDPNDRGEYYNNVIEGACFQKGWHANSNNLSNLPSFFDYNLYSDSDNINIPSGWIIPSDYNLHSVVQSGAITYNTLTMTAAAFSNYAGLNAGRNGGNIGGFEFSSIESDTTPPSQPTGLQVS